MLSIIQILIIKKIEIFIYINYTNKSLLLNTFSNEHISNSTH
jgi:hypothetical protein